MPDDECEIMKPGPHCLCYEGGSDGECCYCTLGLGNCRADDDPEDE